MKSKEYLVLFSLAALWGASFLFIKVAIADMTPLTLVGIRLVLGSLGLLLVVPFSLNLARIKVFCLARQVLLNAAEQLFRR